MTGYYCCICREEVDIDDDEIILVKTFFSKDFAHEKCAAKLEHILR